jgi:hypothetical protein
LLLLFSWSVWRSKWISDDGYIYFAYVRNLTENGWGPVLNRGERVEDFTSPAWYALLSALNWVRPDFILDLRQAVLLMSMAMSIGAVALWIVIETHAARLTSSSRDHEPAAASARGSDQIRDVQGRLNLPLAALAAWYPLQSFATSGLETPLQFLATMLVVVYVWTGNDNDWAVGLLAGVLPLIRPELGLLSVLLLGRHWWRCRSRRSAIPLGVFLAILVGSVLVRIAVYGQVLPNTYYAKTDAGHGFDSGLFYLRDLSLAYGLHWVAAAALLAVVLPLIQRGRPGLDTALGCRLWFLCAAMMLTPYVVSIGGDFMHGRFLLSSVILLAAVFAGWGSELIRRFSSDDRRRAAAAVVVTSVVFAMIADTQPIQALLPPEAAGRPAKFRDISVEAYGYKFRNPDLHAWQQSHVDPWVETGEATLHLADLLDTEIGITQGGIGHFTYAAQANGGRVYTYDRLGLTRLDVARLDMHGATLRVGHAKVAPDVMVATNDRVDLHRPYFEGWADVASFGYEGQRFVIFDPALVDALVDAGVLQSTDADVLREWILERLSGPQIDRNFVTFLTMRYHRDDAVLNRVHELSELDEQSAWRQWLDATAESRELLRPNGCFGWTFLECFAKAFERHRADPIPHLANEPDWAEVS